MPAMRGTKAGMIFVLALLTIFTAACGDDDSASGGGSEPDAAAQSGAGSNTDDAGDAGDDGAVGGGTSGANSFTIDGGAVSIDSASCNFDWKPSAEIDGEARIEGTTLNGLTMNFEFTRYSEEYSLGAGDELLLNIDDPEAPGGLAHFAAQLESGTVAVGSGSASITDATLQGAGDFVEVSFELSC
ncbi:MAG TPA: hypothetical protein GX718_04245 [Brevibacterium sp.]|nr:hypothetical protein [Brevibacterium sp.]